MPSERYEAYNRGIDRRARRHRRLCRDNLRQYTGRQSDGGCRRDRSHTTTTWELERERFSTLDLTE